MCACTCMYVIFVPRACSYPLKHLISWTSYRCLWAIRYRQKQPSAKRGNALNSWTMPSVPLIHLKIIRINFSNQIGDIIIYYCITSQYPSTYKRSGKKKPKFQRDRVFSWWERTVASKLLRAYILSLKQEAEEIELVMTKFWNLEACHSCQLSPSKAVPP